MGHSISPVIHSAAYAYHALDASYELFDCRDRQSVDACLERVRTGVLAGLNVTVPHKRVALELADEVDESARATGAANVVAPVGTRGARRQLRAYNTDAPALQGLLRAGCRRPDGDVVVLGNGGAALAAVVAARSAVSGRVYVSARRWRPGAEPWPSQQQLQALSATPLAWEARPDSEFQRQLATASVIVQATSVGMSGTGDRLAAEEALCQMVPWRRLSKDVFLHDVVYTPPETLFLRQAKLHHLRCQGGLPMLVDQAALAFELWTNKVAPREQMSAAARQSLFGESEG